MRRIQRFAVLVGGSSLACTALFGLDELPLAPLDSNGRPIDPATADAATKDGSPELTDARATSDAGGDAPLSGAKRVFISGPARASDNFKNRVEADRLCAADLGRLDVVAWLSDSSSDAIDQLPDTTPWVNMRGELVFDTKGDIAAGYGPLSQILPYHRGDVVTLVWTGTGANGRKVFASPLAPTNCNDWDDFFTTGVAGNPDINLTQKALLWTNAKQVACREILRLYCFEI